jgi:hypothetical protein
MKIHVSPFQLLHLQPRTDSEIRENCKFQLSVNVALPQQSWDLASRGSPLGSTGVDWRLPSSQAIATICQGVWQQPHRFYDRNDVHRLKSTRDNYGGIVPQKLITKTVNIGLLDHRELQHRSLGSTDCLNAILMDLIDVWGMESPDYQRGMISQIARS